MNTPLAFDEEKNVNKSAQKNTLIFSIHRWIRTHGHTKLRLGADLRLSYRGHADMY